MRISETSLDGVKLIDLTVVSDERGGFVRVFEEESFSSWELRTSFPHHNVVTNAKRGTLRGLHYQLHPFGETKVIHCLAGEIFDVLVDIRPQSPTYRSWESFTLSAERPQLLYAPEGFAHGYQTLTSNTLVHYLMGNVHAPEFQRGIPWDDPQLNIGWPVEDPILSDADQNHSRLEWSAAWNSP